MKYRKEGKKQRKDEGGRKEERERSYEGTEKYDQCGFTVEIRITESSGRQVSIKIKEALSNCVI